MSGEADGAVDWQRVHWATPWIRSGLVFVAIIGAVVSQVIDDLIRGFATAGDGEETTGLAWVFAQSWWLLAAVGLVLVVVLLVALISWLVWRAIRYAVDDDAVYLRKGVISRQQRKARLDRVQSIDINQPLLARIFGLASLKFDVAGGKDSDVTIEFLGKGRAEDLREELLGKIRERRRQAPADDAAPPSPVLPEGHGAPVGDTGEGERRSADASSTPTRQLPSSSSGLVSRAAEAAAGNLEDLARDLAGLFASYRVRPGIGADGQLFRLNIRRLFLSILMSGTTIGLVLLSIGLIVAAIWTESWVWLVSGLPGLAAAGGFLVKRFFDEAHFTVRLSEDGVVVSRGLTTTVRRVIPLDRIQAVGFSQPLLWRRFGWWRVNFNTAATAKAEDGAGADSVILPVGNREDVLAVMALVLPNPGVPDGAALVDALMHGTGEAGGFIPAPDRSRLLDPWQFRRNSYSITQTCVVTRRGALTRIAEWVPHARLQSLGFRQGPLERSRGLATVVLHSTQGPVTPRLHHCDAADAALFLEEQSERSRIARSAAERPERALRQEPPHVEESG